MNHTVAILLGLTLTASANAGMAEEDALPWEDARRFVEALETIRDQYAEPIDDATLISEAIRGMAAGLDPYSVYLDPLEYEQARIDALGRYEGIGVELSRLPEGGYVIVAPFDGGPAQRAGIRAGDRLLSVNGESLERADPAMLDALLHGEAGTAVHLVLQRGDAPPFDVTLTRELIDIPSVSGERLSRGAAYVRIAQFSDRSPEDLARLLHRLSARDPLAGLVIDLRNNSGGVVEAAVDVADLFLDEGIIVSTRGRAAGQDFDYVAQPGDITANVPLVVIVNGGTASAAEILAAALQDHERSVLIGTRTFGKAAVQSLIPLSGGGALKLTTAYYRRPSGGIIEAAGIAPDIANARADEPLTEAPEEDALVRAALELLPRRLAAGAD